MYRGTIILATLLGSVIIGASIIAGCYIISRSPRYEPLDGLQFIETSTGTYYKRSGFVEGGRPQYKSVPGPGTWKAVVEPQ